MWPTQGILFLRNLEQNKTEHIEIRAVWEITIYKNYNFIYLQIYFMSHTDAYINSHHTENMHSN